MDDEVGVGAGPAERAPHAGGGGPAPTPRRRMSAGREREAVLRLLRGEDLELVSRELGVTAAEVRGWRGAFLAAGDGTVRNSVYGRAVEPQPAMALVKRSPKRTANWAFAIARSAGGILHSLSARFKTRNRSFIAASSVGKWPLARTARRSLELSA